MLVMIMHNGLGVGSWNFEVSLSSYSTAVLVFVHWPSGVQARRPVYKLVTIYKYVKFTISFHH